ncbi:MAG: dockerin type I repeat-containing protein [Phycisphaerae bacterium]
MVKKCQTALIVGSVLILALSASGRNWVLYDTPHSLDAWPSMTLSDGILPAISNGTEVYQLTPMGWEQLSGLSGYIAGDGKSRIVSNSQAVKFGADGQFYCVSDLFPMKLSETGIWQVVGPAFPTSYYAWSGCLADPSGWIYMVSDNVLGMTRGSDWQIVTLALSSCDIAVSKYGDVAVGGVRSDPGVILSVSWFDFKSGSWRSHPLSTVSSSRKMDIEFDHLGNLGAAYVNSFNELRFAYFDMDQDFWTDEFVVNLAGGSSPGAALAFDLNNQPVIAAGQTLAFTPPAIVFGTVNLDDYISGPENIPVTIEFRRTDRQTIPWNYTTILHANGKFYVPNAVEPGLYDVAIKASHWLRKITTEVSIGTGSVDIGVISLINGDCDGDNEITSTDLSIILTAMDAVPDDPNWDSAADLNGDNTITSTDLSILSASMDMLGDE